MDKVKRFTRLTVSLCKEFLPTCVDMTSWVFHATLVTMTPGSRVSDGRFYPKNSYFIPEKFNLIKIFCFLEIKRHRWVQNQKEARRLLAQAVEEAPQVGAAIDAMGQVIATLELNMNDSRLPINSNDTPPAQDNARSNDDDPSAGAAAASSSVIRMPDDSKTKRDLNIKKDPEVSPKKEYSSILTPKKPSTKEDLQEGENLADPRDKPVEGEVARTPGQEDIRKAFQIRDHAKNFYLHQEESKLDATQAPFNAGSPRASSTYLEQPRPDSPTSLPSPRSPKSQILYRTVRMQGELFNFFFKTFKR